VSGCIYCFFDEKIRDTLFNKFFLLEEPSSPPPPAPVQPFPTEKIILVETRALEYFTQHYLANTSQSVYDLIMNDTPTEEIEETMSRIVCRNVKSTVLKTCRHEELNENILENLYNRFVDKVMDAISLRKRENNTPKKPKTKKVGVCITCKSIARLRCDDCKRACYCNVSCQRRDWLHHKEICEGCN
jgi:hypothetical protein